MSEFTTAFPNSTKRDIDGPHGVRVPMREIALSGGEPPLRVYDTSGPQDHDVTVGLPKLRASWIRAREAARPSILRQAQGSGRAGLSPCVTQLHYARKGEITPEMQFVA